MFLANVPGVNKAEHFGEGQVALVLDGAGFCAGWILLLELMGSEHITAQAYAGVVRHIVQTQIPKIFSPVRPPSAVPGS